MLAAGFFRSFRGGGGCMVGCFMHLIYTSILWLLLVLSVFWSRINAIFLLSHQKSLSLLVLISIIILYKNS